MTDVNQLLDGREKRYGSFENNARYSQTLKAAMKGEAWDALALDQKEALEMVAHKIARVLNGDPNYADNWVDIAGYAQLVANRLEKAQ